jgi:hypothetical protein
MASEHDVRQYLICWWQLGKSLVHHTPAGDNFIRPDPLLLLDPASPSLAVLWDHIQQAPQDYYLAGTSETLADLLSSRWELVPCAGCQLPIPIRRLGIHTDPCPCHDLQNWPSRDTLPPRTYPPEHLQLRLHTLHNHLAHSAAEVT